MINLYDVKFKTTLMEASEDDKNGEYMTQSTEKVIDFDKVKEEYIKNILPKVTPASNDVLMKIDDKIYFIEFKNGNITKKEIYNVKRKIFESLLIFSDITGETISFTRENVNYILVYNGEKSKKYIEHIIEERQKCNLNKLEDDEIQESVAFDEFTSQMAKLANYHMDIFGLDKQFSKMYFKSVKTYDIDEFNEKFI